MENFFKQNLPILLFLVVSCMGRSSLQNEKPPARILSKIMFVDAEGGLRVREEPNINSKVIKSLKYGDRVSTINYSENTSVIDGIEDNWISIKLSKNKIGWVFGGFLYETHPFISHFEFSAEFCKGSSKLIMNDNYTWKGKFYTGGFENEHNCGFNEANGTFYWDTEKKRVCFIVDDYTKYSPIKEIGKPACYIFKKGHIYTDKENNGFLINYDSEYFQDYR